MKEVVASVQPRFAEHDVKTAFSYLLSFGNILDDAPAYGTRARTEYLREVWRDEPILTGAVYALVAKVVAWPWLLTGGKYNVSRAQSLLQHAEDGAGWSFFLSRAVLDFLTTNVGALIEVGYSDVEQTRIGGIYNLDAGQCDLTGSARYPVRYFPSAGGNAIDLAAHQVLRVCSMPLADERYNGRGYCAVERSLRAAKLLTLIYTYKEEKLSNLPPQGLAAVTGNLTDAQWTDALSKYKAGREGRNQMVFPGLLFLLADQLDIKIVPFSSLPDSFDERETVDIYAQTLALDFGVDVAEFWNIKQAGMTRPNNEVQHLKAKGKGPGEIMSGFSRVINFSLMPRGVTFEFGAQDSDDILRETETQQAQADVVMTLFEKGQGIIDKLEARELAARQGVLPEDMVRVDDVTVDDTEGTKTYDEVVRVHYEPERDRVKCETLTTRRRARQKADTTAQQAARELRAAWGDYTVDFALPPDDAPVEITEADIAAAATDVTAALEEAEDAE